MQGRGLTRFLDSVDELQVEPGHENEHCSIVVAVGDGYYWGVSVA